MLHGNDISTVHSGAFYSLRSLQVTIVMPNVELKESQAVSSTSPSVWQINPIPVVTVLS